MLKYFIGAILLVVIGYGGMEALPLISGPSISVVSPRNDETSQSGIVTIDGKASRAAQLTLDGTPILYDQNGSFSSTVTLPRGGSILTLVATDPFGKKVAVTRTVFVP